MGSEQLDAWCIDPGETPQHCVTFHAPSKAVWNWTGGGVCFDSTQSSSNGQYCALDSQCASGYPQCLSAYKSGTGYTLSCDDTFFNVFNQGQGLMVYA